MSKITHKQALEQVLEICKRGDTSFQKLTAIRATAQAALQPKPEPKPETKLEEATPAKTTKPRKPRKATSNDA